MSDTTAVYAEIVKHERDANGDLVVYGRATGPDLDLDQQICDRDWLKSAMPAWFQTGANLREQHGSVAAGVGQEIVEKPDGGWDLKALVVDPVSARKVERGVLKGYSVGIRSPKVVKDASAPGGRIVDGQIVEVSLVDRPANATCTLTLAKALKPGPQTVAPGTVDADRHLVKVEELHDRSGEPLAALKALDRDLVAVVKGDRAGDIADAQQAIAIIAGLIQAEAVCLADGRLSEACDIGLLLDAVRALEWFICREKKEEPMAHAHVDLADKPDAEKAAAPDAAPTPAPAPEAPSTETPAPAAEKAVEGEQKTDLTELVKAAVAEAVAPIQAQLAKAMNAPAPGGPVLTRTTEDTTKAAAREIHLAKAEHYDRLAYEVTDPQARAGYLQMAADERATATS